MKFVCLAGKEVAQEELKREFKTAGRKGEVRLGHKHLFYRYFIKIRFISYEEIVRAYLREESGESGEFLLKEFYLMLEDTAGVLYKFRMERKVNARDVLDDLGKRHGHIMIGFNRDSQAGHTLSCDSRK